jgi:peptide/nickel transport system substrate-binding protein
MNQNTISRREFLRVSAIVAAASVAAACGGEQPATQEPVSTGGQTPAGPAVPTSAPVAQPTTALTMPTETPAAVSRYNEAPMLAELVQAGELPPVEERLPAEPMVIAPTTMIGKYGGTLTGASSAPEATDDLQAAMITGPFYYNNDLSVMLPNVCESYELNEDFTTCILHYRKGIKWSDGAPFTTEDTICYFDDWQFNKDIVPNVSQNWRAGGEPMTYRKIDDHTIEFHFAVPNPAFFALTKSSPPIPPWIPAHHARKFHKTHNPNAEAEAKAAGFDTWQAWFIKMAHAKQSYYGAQPPEVPVLEPWRPAKADSEGQYYERNPYYFKVDTEGNQLPYIDYVDVRYTSSMDVINMRAVSGELSALTRDLLLMNYPILRENQEKGDYTLRLGSCARGAEISLAFNQNHPDPVLGEIFRDLRFRQAISVAIDRNEINELLFLGQGVPRQATVHDSCCFWQQRWADHYIQFDLDLANQLLDEVGLSERNADGVRLRSDGQPLAFLLEYSQTQAPFVEAAELLVKQLDKVGIRVEAREEQKAFKAQRIDADEHDCNMWFVDRTLERAHWSIAGGKLRPGDNGVCTGWQQWMNSGGETGVEPPDIVKKAYAAFDRWKSYDFGTEEYKQAAIEAHDYIMEGLWQIGVVGQVPVPILVKNNLENVFTGQEDRILIGASNWYLMPQRAEQWFWKD